MTSTMANNKKKSPSIWTGSSVFSKSGIKVLPSTGTIYGTKLTSTLCANAQLKSSIITSKPVCQRVDAVELLLEETLNSYSSLVGGRPDGSVLF